MKSRRNMFQRRRLAWLAVAALLTAPYARADDNQAGGPLVINPQQAVSPLNLQPVTGDLDLDYLYQRDTDKEGNAPTTSSTEDSFLETLNAQTAGNIFNPNFATFNAGGTFGLEQDFYGGTNGSAHGNNTIEGWDLSATGLPNSSNPFSVFSRQTVSFINPVFSPTLRDTLTTYGANATFQNSLGTTLLSYSHDDDKQTQTGDITNYLLHQDNATWHTNFLTAPNQSLTFDYDYQNTKSQETLSPQEHYQTNDATLTHNVNFGPGLLDSLSSCLSYTGQSGFLNYQETHVDELLRVWESPVLQTHYEYSFDNTRVNGINETTNKIDAGFIHHLYESLVTSGDVGGQLYSEDGTDIGDIFSHLDFAYRKLVPDGVLLSNLDLGWDYQHESAAAQEIPILNQAQMFNDDTPVTLNPQNPSNGIFASGTQTIDLKSIKIFSDGIVYQPGKDYQVGRLGDLVEIQRIASGRIPFDGSVLMDYNLLAQPSNTTNTGDLDVGSRYQIQSGPLAGLSPYARYSLQQQSIDSSQSNLIIPENFRDTTVGSDYVIGKFAFNAEQDWHQSSLVPYDASRFSARYADRLGVDTTYSFDGEYQYTDYYDDNDIANDLTVSANLTRRLNSVSTLTARLIYLNSRDHLFGNSQGLEEDLQLDVQYRQFDLYANLRNSFLNGDDDHTTFQTFEIGVRRNF